MDIRSSSFNFPETEDTGPQSASAQLVFPRAVTRTAIGISGYSALFENRDDHHLGFLTVEVNAAINGTDATRVDVSGVFGLRDWSNEWDDPYRGIVEFVVFADLVPATPPAPGASRGDLIVVDAEINQAIQHFRSHLHLDSLNVLPDNSVRLVADKPTAVRLYVDYDATSGLAPIARLGGELIVTANGTSTTLAPLATIVPRRDGAIDRGQRDHTLNFLIPEALCRGTIEIAARAISAADATQFSAEFARTLTFETMPALPIMAVGIEYTGNDVSDSNALAAPTMADFATLFGFTEATYPIPNMTITSFVTMSYDKDIKSDINEGCDKFSDLKDAVADLRGDSDDIVYGLYNSGVDTGSVGGCGGGGVAVGRIGAQGTAAHEVGHALGRQHAPCDNVTRCADPLNTDGNYPRYAGFDSDSIGEYGFDTRPAAGMVPVPGTAHDMMGYSGNRWISPYTYKALMSRIPESFGAGATSAAFAEGAALQQRKRDPRGCWIPIAQPRLFLRMDIERDRSVRMQAAFTFDALPRPRGERCTDFTIELLDREGKRLRRNALFGDDTACGCSCAASPWPLRIRHAVAFDPLARTMVLYECDKELQRWPIGEAPVVELAVSGHKDPRAAELYLQWKVNGGEGAGQEIHELWFLVQWRDARGTWRGAAPRMRGNDLRVPKRLFKGAPVAALRVLASAGLATGTASWEGPLERAPSGRPKRPAVGLVGIDAAVKGAHLLPDQLRAFANEEDGSMRPAASLRWYDGRGAELARGRTLDLGRLGHGQHQIAVVASGDPVGSATWLIERRRDGRCLLLVGDQKASKAQKGQNSQDSQMED